METVTYIVDLRNIKAEDTELDYLIDDAYFETLDESEVKKGSISVHVHIKKRNDSFQFQFQMKGHIIINCDRCLDNMIFKLDIIESLKVKFGVEYSNEYDGLLVIPDGDGTIDLSWIMYEYIALAIPLKHVHEDGLCNVQMIEELNKHFNVDDGDGIDPRWEALKATLDNN